MSIPTPPPATPPNTPCPHGAKHPKPSKPNIPTTREQQSPLEPILFSSEVMKLQGDETLHVHAQRRQKVIDSIDQNRQATRNEKRPKSAHPEPSIYAPNPIPNPAPNLKLIFTLRTPRTPLKCTDYPKHQSKPKPTRKLQKPKTEASICCQAQ